jgi:PAS domain S-box-containing protein
MLGEILTTPEFGKYRTSFRKGQTIFLEGDTTQDLYILVSGQLDILKGDKRIDRISEQGTLFGEMSFLLGAARTATAKASSDLEAICIPKEEISTLLHEFPDIAGEITKLLAKRLDETSQVLYGLKGICDQLPDAVILSDKDGKILSCNTAAETLYGRNWHAMHHTSVENIYEEPQIYRDFLGAVKEKYSVREEVLKIKHPEKGTRFVSTSTTLLHDGHHNFQGVLSLGRDVTEVQNLQRKYRKARNWLLPALFLLGLVTVAAFLGYPYFSRGYRTVDIEKQGLRNALAKDYLFLTSLLVDHFKDGDRVKAGEVMADFFALQETTVMPYSGLVLLDKKKKVFCAYSPARGAEAPEMIGSSYAGIAFEGDERSLHRVLTLYRADKQHPMGHKGIEVAFRVVKDNHFSGWLVFQMDMDMLEKDFGLNEEDLRLFQFNES